MNPLSTPKIVDKPWGREIWYADATAYAGKILEVKQGHRLSLQKHEIKEETLYLLSGKVKLTFIPPDSSDTPETGVYEWLPGSSVHIPTGTVHRFEAVEDSVLLEVSTPHLTDVVRLEDDYARRERD
ncbi:MAG: cupin [Pleurocapsa sp. SU_196_0]|nr:cupin [Pleurocapsa sp. SU_196_0]